MTTDIFDSALDNKFRYDGSEDIAIKILVSFTSLEKRRHKSHTAHAIVRDTKNALLRLKKNQRTVLFRYYVLRDTQSEIADELNCTQQRVYAILHQALKNFVKELGDENDGPQ